MVLERNIIPTLVNETHHAWVRPQPNCIPSWRGMQVLERHRNFKVV